MVVTTHFSRRAEILSVRRHGHTELWPWHTESSWRGAWLGLRRCCRVWVAGVDQREPPVRAQVAGASGRFTQVVRAPRWGLRFAQTPATPSWRTGGFLGSSGWHGGLTSARSLDEGALEGCPVAKTRQADAVPLLRSGPLRLTPAVRGPLHRYLPGGRTRRGSGGWRDRFPACGASWL